MIITCISDLHGETPTLPGGDLLLIGGDITARGLIKEWDNFFSWLRKQKYRKIVLIAGNHDGFLKHSCSSQESRDLGLYDNTEPCEYLRDSGCEFEGLKIWGSPWTSWFKGIHPEYAHYTKRTEDELRDCWELIPEDTDILLTHSPPYGVYDSISSNIHVGSTSLKKRLEKLPLKLHVFGHIHEHGGKTMVLKDITMVNASYLDEKYTGTNPIVTLEL